METPTKRKSGKSVGRSRSKAINSIADEGYDEIAPEQVTLMDVLSGAFMLALMALACVVVLDFFKIIQVDLLRKLF